MKEQRFLFKFYYIGTKKYYGSQRQKNLLTIEGSLIEVLKTLKYINSIRDSDVEFASRTDRGVSALGAALTFVPLRKPYLIEINSMLPKEIGIWAYAKVPKNFLSRYNAIFRHYKYLVPIPDRDNGGRGLDFKLMQKARKILLGTHNFLNFSKKGKKEVKTIRTIDFIDIRRRGKYLIFDFKSRAYLRQQIRRMVKKIMELGLGEISYDDFLSLLDASKYISYEPADPTGLVLWNIEYDKSIIFKIDPKSFDRMNKYFLNQKRAYHHKYELFKTLQENDIS
ncbi:MAG: tRNA pseudouridine(38-40) synthase TruA [Candidatus Lokiarchaeota archaeon]|nr:tRNA pseudouridine(38-40) synthase TruA [Candidatus Lokiarchaeota archaeon]MBD3339237.1 tRNA pseudouridine(38-40) synthase TruA [Candidatus Lokiarchaeota archaeon]